MQSCLFRNMHRANFLKILSNIGGSRGTWQAAVAAVASAIAAADKVLDGDCVNAFCITRPPGHHAGTTLHSMHACSNGFCILNPAACAALYATLPVAEGGLGLSRVCIIDFDVHVSQACCHFAFRIRMLEI